MEVLPVLLTTRAGLEGIDEALRALSDQELDAIVERARSRRRDLMDATGAVVIDEALRSARASRSTPGGPGASPAPRSAARL